MNDILMLVIGALVGLISALIVQLVSHKLSRVRDQEKIIAEQLIQTRNRRVEKIDLLEAEVMEKSKRIAELEAETLDQIIYVIMLKNQMRDGLLGFDQDEQNSRAIDLQIILSKKGREELEMIAHDKKPMPELPGKPKALTYKL